MIFVDSSFWIAAAVAGDAHHAEAVELVSRYAGDRLVTTSHVGGETWTFIRRRFGHAQAVALLDRLERTPRLQLLAIDADLEREAWTWLRRRDERPYSFVDAISFALMRSLRIHEALAFDGDFSAAGFVELRA